MKYKRSRVGGRDGLSCICCMSRQIKCGRRVR